MRRKKKRLNRVSKPLLIVYENGLLGCTKAAMCSHLVCALQLWFCNKIKHHMKLLLLETTQENQGQHPSATLRCCPKAVPGKGRFITGGSKLIGPSDVTSTVRGEVILLESDLLSTPQQSPFHSVPTQSAHKSSKLCKMVHMG